MDCDSFVFFGLRAALKREPSDGTMQSNVPAVRRKGVSFHPSGKHPRPVLLLRKEVIQPLLPQRLPCYDFIPLTLHTVDSSLLTVRLPASGADDSSHVTGGVYKARERIHRSMLIYDY